MEWNDDWLAKDRQEYQDDPNGWLRKRFVWITEKVNDQTQRQANEAKEFAQSVADSLTRSLLYSQTSLILWLGLIVTVSLASAGLWLGAGVVTLILAWVWLRNLLRRRMLWRLDRFRDDFRRLLEIAEQGRIGRKMLESDKALLEKCKDSILFPLAVAPLCRKTLYPSIDLERIEILYREYCRSHACILGKCDLCGAKQQVGDHIERVVSTFEARIETDRIVLITRINGQDSDAAIRANNFLEKYREWERWRYPQDSEFKSNKNVRSFPLLETLREKEYWTFEAVDKVRGLCRTEREQREERAVQMFDVLTSEMEAAAKRCGVEEAWRFYDEASTWLFDWNRYPTIRCALGRENPETTVRELIHADGSFRARFDEYLQPLKNYGFDLEFVRRELRAAWKLVAEERRTRRAELQVFSAAQSFYELEEAENWRRAAAAPERW